MLASMYHFWGVHNLYQAKSARLILESRVKLGFFLFSFFAFHFSFFLFSLFDFVIRFKLGPITLFWHSKSYFDIQNRADYRFLTFKVFFWHLNWGQIAYFDIKKMHHGMFWKSWILTFRPPVFVWGVGGLLAKYFLRCCCICDSF